MVNSFGCKKTCNNSSSKYFMMNLVISKCDARLVYGHKLSGDLVFVRWLCTSGGRSMPCLPLSTLHFCNALRTQYDFLGVACCLFERQSNYTAEQNAHSPRRLPRVPTIAQFLTQQCRQTFPHRTSLLSSGTISITDLSLSIIIISTSFYVIFYIFLIFFFNFRNNTGKHCSCLKIHFKVLLAHHSSRSKMNKKKGTDRKKYSWLPWIGSLSKPSYAIFKTKLKS